MAHIRSSKLLGPRITVAGYNEAAVPSGKRWYVKRFGFFNNTAASNSARLSCVPSGGARVQIAKVTCAADTGTIVDVGLILYEADLLSITGTAAGLDVWCAGIEFDTAT